ncbi:MAG: DNA-processing protein DprA [Oscillospiraceae bacterium]|nr:DNA-processing protein DprA [Oscillospiraceae bacterium]
MAKSSVEVWLWLLLVMQPFNKKTNFILSECSGDAQLAAKNIRDGKYGFLSDAEKKNAESVRTKDVRELMETCVKQGVRIITLDDDEYPPLLRGIENPPIVLFCAGSLAGLDKAITLSAVGTRNVSDYGINVTHRMIEPLARLGVAVVSGMAVGTDAEVHKACLAAKGRTIGVLGCGILVNYPAENAQLKRDIIANGGAIISELLPYSRSFAAYFNTRNRIISGLSLGTLVIEAGDKSGALLTARHASEQEREVFCVPPRDLYSSRFNGVVPLLREDALPVYNFTDILNEFAMYFADEKYVKDYVSEIEKTQHDRKEPRKPRNRSKETAEAPETETELTEELLSSLEQREAAVLKLLAESSAKVDEIIEKSGFEYNELTEILTNLEIAGYVERGRDGTYSIMRQTASG